MDSYIEINTSNIASNITKLAKDKKPCLMVKANCYGLGKEVINQLINLGYDYFGVSTIKEAFEIRQFSKDVDILIVTYVDPKDFKLCIENTFTVSILDVEGLRQVIPSLKYHLKIDTGMNRLGFKEYEFKELVEEVNKVTIIPEGIYTHFGEATNKNRTDMQLSLFKQILDKIDIKFKYIHVQNTLGCILYDLDFVNMVRPGIGIFGLLSTKEEYIEHDINLKNVFTMSALVSQSKYVDGDVGYDFSQYHKGYLTTIRLGYHDGISRGLTGFNLGNRDKIVGKICMCQLMIACEYHKRFYPFITSNEDIYNMIEYLNITVYELLVSFSNRLERRFINE